MNSEFASSSIEDQVNIFSVPFTEAELHKDILTLYICKALILGFMASEELAEETISKILCIPSTLFPPGISIQEPEFWENNDFIKYESISNSRFAKSLEEMYQYAYFGRLDISGEALEFESHVTWISGILDDLCQSNFLAEWDYIGGQGLSAAKRCFQTAELANARIILEGGQEFYYFGHEKQYDGKVEKPGLTIRQLSLLSGMEEMSIRAVTNPKRAVNLPIFKDSQDRTLVAINDAKEWLKGKGLYIPITRFHGKGDTEITNRRYLTIAALHEVLDVRLDFILRQSHDTSAVNELLSKFGHLDSGANPTSQKKLRWNDVNFEDVSILELVGRSLEILPDLLALRVKETRLIEELNSVEVELKIKEGLFTELWSYNRESVQVFPHLKTKRGSLIKGFEITLTGKKEDYHLVDLDQFLKYIAEGRFDEIGRVRMKPRDGGQSNGFAVKKLLMSPELKLKIEKLRQEI